MDDIGAIIFLIIFAISLIGSVIQKFSGAGQQEPDEEQRPERPRARDLPAATRRQMYGTGSPRAAEVDEDDEDDGQPVAPIPVQNLWQQRQQRQQRGGDSPPPPPTRRQPAPSREEKSFRPQEQAPWRPQEKERVPSPEAAQRASADAAERARRQREMQRQRARDMARDPAKGGAERLASNEERMRVQREKLAEATKKRDEARQRVSTTRASSEFRSERVKRKPRRSQQLTQLGRLMRNERAIRTGFIFSEVLGKPKALREETGSQGQG